MRPVKGIIFTLLLHLVSGNAEAEPPRTLTKDKRVALDARLLGNQQNNLLDCNFRVEGKSPNFRLVYKDGEIPIPVLAIKRIQDGRSVEVAIRNGELLGMAVRRVWLFYLGELDASRLQRGSWKSISGEGGNSYSLLVEADAATLETTLTDRFGHQRVSSNKNSRIDSGVVVLKSHPDTVSSGGYKIGLWTMGRKATQLDYQCTFEAQ